MKAAIVLGARQALCTAKHPHQKAMAERLGASVLPGTEQEAVERDTKAATDDMGADVVVETVGGVSDTTEAALRAVRKGGTVMLVGAYPQSLEVSLSTAIFCEIRIIGSNCYSAMDGERDFHVCIRAMASGEARLMPLVTHTFPLEHIGEAMRAALDKTIGAIKVQIVFP
ncbi:MAG: zinc-binding dehydrogenase [Armatimonadota bacterium]